MDKKFQLTFADGTTVELTLAEILTETTTLYNAVKARQKVGNDSDGREVYEYDKVKAPFEPEPFRADMSDIYRVSLYDLVEVAK